PGAYRVHHSFPTRRSSDLGGCFYSRLWAGTGVTVESGVFRGEAATVSRGHVTMDEAGSPWGTEVRITILEDGVFKARRVHPGVHVVIGGAGCVFRTGARGVVVRPAGRELEVTAASWGGAGPAGGARPPAPRRQTRPKGSPNGRADRHPFVLYFTRAQRGGMSVAEQRFRLVSDYTPKGDQPQAIEQLVEGIEAGLRFQTLLGAT